ncbi:PREDICTED: uncharacterized protein LOC104816868 [Tarenaya hassleriana]|uniref:uncharacterized protein LOC104816868 n=1 Tax=Tarenaya hassleriana TaxID=28532 RepID=UPI00053C56C1|nr:PREDICTED: uncharacterized protein LOC104816868 [Tarenaya hassleriana]
METLFTSVYISSLPGTKPSLRSSPSSSPPSSSSSSLFSCCLCNRPTKRITELRLSRGSAHGFRLRALLHGETRSEGDDNLAGSNGFDLFSGDILSLSQEKVKGDQSGEKDVDKAMDLETSLVLPHGVGKGTRAGLFRTPISGGVQSATSVHGLPRPALAVRNLMEQARFAQLCTLMSKIHHHREGYPFGSLVDFVPDPMGHPIFLFSPLAIHTRNLLAEPRCSLVVQVPGWSGLSNARVTLFGDVYLLPEDQQVWAHKQYIAKHRQGPSQQWGNLYYFRMQNISDIYFIGGFGTVDWVNVKEYEALQPDKIAVDGGDQNLKELNGIFSKRLRQLLSTESEVDDAALISIDSRGIDIRVRRGAQFNIQRLSFEEGHVVETLEEAKAALQEVIKKKGQKLQNLQK